MSFHPVPVVLDGRAVRLEPLEERHAEDLLHAGQDEGIWRYMPIPPPHSLEEISGWIAEALAMRDSGAQIPFAIIHVPTGKAIGSTRFLEIERAHGTLEIGWTWIAKEHQRSRANTECKFLMLTHAFEDLKAMRVQFKTDGRNLRSQRAIERLGGVREGTLRKHSRLWDGYVRDTVFFSILDSEWPGIRQRLKAILQR